MYFLHICPSQGNQTSLQPPKPPHPSSSTTCALPPPLSSLSLHLTQSLPSLFLRSPNTTCSAAAWRAWGAARRPPAPTAPRTPPRRPCPPLRPTPSPTPRLRAFRLLRPSPPTPTTLDCTPSRCPSNSPAPPSLQHGLWVHQLSCVCASVCVCVYVCVVYRLLWCTYKTYAPRQKKKKNSPKLSQVCTCAGMLCARESRAWFRDSFCPLSTPINMLPCKSQVCGQECRCSLPFQKGIEKLRKPPPPRSPRGYSRVCSFIAAKNCYNIRKQIPEPEFLYLQLFTGIAGVFWANQLCTDGVVLIDVWNRSRVVCRDPARGLSATEVSPPTVTQLTSPKQERQEANRAHVFMCRWALGPAIVPVWLTVGGAVGGSSGVSLFAERSYAWWAPLVM